MEDSSLVCAETQVPSVKPAFYHKRRMSATGLLLSNSTSTDSVPFIEDDVLLLSKNSCRYQRRNSISLSLDEALHSKTTSLVVAEDLIRVVPRTVVILNERLEGLRSKINANKYGRQSRALRRHLNRIGRCLSQTVMILRCELKTETSDQEGGMALFIESSASVDAILSAILYLLFNMVELIQLLDQMLHSIQYKDKCSSLNKEKLIQIHHYLTDALDSFDEAFRVMSHAIPIWTGEQI